MQPAGDWKDIVGWEGFYQADSNGFIRSVARSVTIHHKRGDVVRRLPFKIMKPRFSKGYANIKMSSENNAVYRVEKVSTLVLETFVGPRPHPSLYCCHDNGDKTDDRAANLYWGTPTQNSHDRARHGTKLEGELIPFSKLIEADVRYIRSNPDRLTQYQLADKFGITQGAVSLIVLRKNWKHID